MSAPTITIDGRPVEIVPGETILQAARKLGLDIPTLCYLEKCGPMNSCLVCVVKVTQNGRSRIVPSCGLRAEDGMVVESETEEVRELRRSALELLFSDHVGDCLSPCHRICPLDLNIPRMIRQIEAGRNDEAIATIRTALALPATLGRLCHAPCQNGCRRTGCDDSAAIRDLERFAADADYGFHSASPDVAEPLTRPSATLSPSDGERAGVRGATNREDANSTGPAREQSARPDQPHLPPRLSPSGKTVAIVGTGPTGLAAAYHLLQQGHACVLFDRNAQAGGTLRTQPDEKALPREILDAEIRQIERLGAKFVLSSPLGPGLTLDTLQSRFDAVLLSTGEMAKVDATLAKPTGQETTTPQTDSMHPLTPSLSPSDGERVSEGRVRGNPYSETAWFGGIALTVSGIQVDPATYLTSVPKVFAAGSVVKVARQLVRAMSEGQTAAECIHQFLIGQPVHAERKALSSVMGRLEAPELRLFLNLASPAPRSAPAAGLMFGFNPSEARGEASRCLHCDCRSAGHCDLQRYAELYDANPNRFPRERRAFRQELHPAGVIFEPGKCILCGICVHLAKQAAEPLGLSFVGRGFDVQVAAPFDRAFGEGLQKVAAECVAACPTGAIVFRDPRLNHA